jgi:hypothetical protein
MPSSQTRRRPSSFWTPTTSTLCNGGPLNDASFQRSINDVLTQPLRHSSHAMPNSARRARAGYWLNIEAYMVRLS